MTGVFAALLSVHLALAFGATAVFWIAATTPKGERTHRGAGHWFARLVYAAAATGGVLAIAGLAIPRVVHPIDLPLSAALTRDLASARQMNWFVLYLLLVIVTPVQHGLAVVAAGASPRRVRSRLHLSLNLLAMLGSFVMFPAALLWQQWLLLFAVPMGFVIGLRNMRYADVPAATPVAWRREHLTSLITAGIGLHTALLVFGSSRSLGMSLAGWTSVVPWVAPAAIGIAVIAWLRRA